MTKFIYNISFGLAIFLLFSMCEKADEVTLEYDLNEFKNININHVFRVVLIQDSSYRITISGLENIVNQVDCSVYDNYLTVKDIGNKRWLNPGHNIPYLHIYAPDFSNININESCFVRTQDTIQTDYLYLIMRGKLNEASLNLNCGYFRYSCTPVCGGKTVVNGNADILRVHNRGLMQFNAKNFAVDSATLFNYSKNNGLLRVSKYLRYGIYNKGNIILYSNPLSLSKRDDNGKGELIKTGEK